MKPPAELGFAGDGAEALYDIGGNPFLVGMAEGLGDDPFLLVLQVQKCFDTTPQGTNEVELSTRPKQFSILGAKAARLV